MKAQLRPLKHSLLIHRSREIFRKVVFFPVLDELLNRG